MINPYLCGCGCEGELPKARHASKQTRYLPGHRSRMQRKHTRFVVEDRGYNTLCWIWQLSRKRNGYGELRKSGRTMYAHRWMYEQHVGPIPEGRDLDHLCRVRACVNPDHLEVVTRSENNRRGALAKLTARDVSDIRQRAQQGEMLKGLAEEYGIAPSYVSQLVRHKSWRDDRSTVPA